MASNKAIVSPSVYVNRLRRAFILRCHPDQFRQHDDAIRKQQGVLLQVRPSSKVDSLGWKNRLRRAGHYDTFHSSPLTLWK